jgi:hypothetical protein
MKLFGQLVRTAVNIATLPVAVAKDVTGEPIITGKSATMQQLQKIKDEAEEK